jgi:hypothetical protein
MPSSASEVFCGNAIGKEQLAEIVKIVATFPNLTRTELANTICELNAWKRPTGKLKTVECRQFLERLEAKGMFRLPDCQKKYAKREKLNINRPNITDDCTKISVKLKELRPLLLDKVNNCEERKLWYEFIDRYHYLGYRLPFGAQLRYFIKSAMTHDRLGCLQFSSPAWRMAARDKWIGWNDTQRRQNLQMIISNSRFLIFPWVRVKNLASATLSLAVKIVPDDWRSCYGYNPVMIETLVDKKQFNGTCYKAANWIYLGETSGRGRMDHLNKRNGMAVKDIFVYPLSSNFRRSLLAGGK